MPIAITASELKSGLGDLKTLVADIEAAWAARLSDAPDDLTVIADATQIAGDFGVPDAALIASAARAAAWLLANAPPQMGGGVLGALADSLSGVQRTVANPSGAIGEG